MGCEGDRLWVKVGNIIHGERLEKEDGEAPWSRLCQIRECWIHERLRIDMEAEERIREALEAEEEEVEGEYEEE